MKHKKKWHARRRNKFYKKLRRGNSRQVLKEELRTLAFREEAMDFYGETGLSATGIGGNSGLAA